MKTKVYCIKNNDGQFLTSNGYWGTFPHCRLIATKAKAEDELYKFYMQNLCYYRTKEISELKTWSVVEMELDYDVNEQFSNTNQLIDVLVKKELENISTSFSYFWEHLIKIGTSTKVEYLVRVKPLGNYYTPDKEQLKEIRNTIRLLGVKTNQYRSQGYNFAFNSAEEAMNARLCLDVDEFLNIKELKEKVTALVETKS